MKHKVKLKELNQLYKSHILGYISKKCVEISGAIDYKYKYRILMSAYFTTQVIKRF